GRALYRRPVRFRPASFARRAVALAGALAAVTGAAAASTSPPSSTPVGTTPGTGVRARILLITGSSTDLSGAPDGCYVAIRLTLRRLGIPFDEFPAVQMHATGVSIALN